MRIWLICIVVASVFTLTSTATLSGGSTAKQIQKERDNKITSSQRVTAAVEPPPRTQRQTAPRRIGVFAALSQIIFGTARDIGNAYSQVTRIVSNTIIPTRHGIQLNTTSSVITPSPNSNATTTEEPYRITQQEALDIIRRNLYGLVRLFRKELNMAIEDSKKNAAQADSDLREALRPYLT